MILAASVSTISLVCNIIAAQNEKAAIIQMLGYISLVYSFLGDIFIFNVSLNPLQIIGVIIVIGFSVGMIVYNYTHAAPKQAAHIKEELKKPLDQQDIPLDVKVTFERVK
jgi:drug/metabolite transporter (DMT)-like permease